MTSLTSHLSGVCGESTLYCGTNYGRKIPHYNSSPIVGINLAHNFTTSLQRKSVLSKSILEDDSKF